MNRNNEKDAPSESPAQELARFLDFVDRIAKEYRFAWDDVGREDKRLQDLLHALELAKGGKEVNQAMKRLRESRKERRKNKDTTKRLELVAQFFEIQQNRSILNQMRQLLGNQRKREESLEGERFYRPRVPEDAS